MAVLNDKQLKKLIEENDLVTDMIDPAVQVQSNGVELTLQSIKLFVNHGKLAFDNSERTLPKYDEISFDKDGWRWLMPGSYLITYNETVNIPKDCCAFSRTRSSLLRMGAMIEGALWDSGYIGRSQSLLVVTNPNGIELRKDARLIQLVFLKGESDADKLYSGVYQGENL